MPHNCTLQGAEIASYPGSLGRGKKEPGIYCLRLRLIKVWITREFEFLRNVRWVGSRWRTIHCSKRSAFYMDSFLCRLCRASIAGGSAVCLFSQTAVRRHVFLACHQTRRTVLAKTCRQPEKYVLSFVDCLDASCLFVFQSHRSTDEAFQSVQNRSISLT